MRTHDFGDIGEMKVSIDLIAQGWSILRPVSFVSPFDLVAYKGGAYRRVQVKYCRLKGGTVTADCTRARIARARYESRANDEVDVFAVYCPDTDKCYYVAAAGRASFVLRIEPPRNNQRNLVRNADDFRLML